ncbi:MAG: TolC family protein [Poseidonibacter sp.]
MHFQKSNNIKLLLCSLISLNLFANEFSLNNEEILSDTRKKSFDLTQEKANEDSAKLKKDWINPITYNYTKNFGEEYKNEKSVISIDQPIFRSGGIYEAIKYANSTQKYADLEISQERKTLIHTATNYLFLIKKTDLNIQKAQLSLMNAKIDVNRKKEQVLNGFLDSSYLDDALLTQNSAKHTLVDLKYQKQELINNFHNIASKNYTEFSLPTLKMFSEKDYLDNNIEIKKAQANINKKDNFKGVTAANYLPSLNAFYTYTDNHFKDGQSLSENTQVYGLRLTIPFDIRTFNDIESKKLDYLKSKVDLQNKITDEKTFFKSKLEKINMIEDRITITKEDLNIYDSILSIINEEKEAQLKTQSDLDTLQNSQKIKVIDLKTYEIDKQIELLSVYTKLHY